MARADASAKMLLSLLTARKPIRFPPLWHLLFIE